ncbi:MAG: hypothetical protein IKG96_02560 [Bacteroidaceae bacterium]|nr:hypothetical protein [Bacteroidaceae bacterium]
MKKLLTVVALAFAAISVNAQDYNTYVGGGVRFQSTSDETLFAIQPEIGYKLTDTFSLGIAVGFGTSGSGSSKYTEFLIQPYVRHSLLKIGGNVNFFLDYQLGYKNSGLKDNKTNTFEIGAAPGLAWNVNPRLSVVTHLGFIGYQSSKLDVEGSKAVNKFTVEAITQNLGLSVYYNF